MTEINELPELVRHLQLEANFQRGRTVHEHIRTRIGPRKRNIWIRQKKIGHGGFGEVWLERKLSSTQDTMATRTPELRAVKCIHASVLPRDYVRELEALATFSTNKSKYLEFFVQFHGWFRSDEWLHAIMEYCELGDLRQYLQKNGRLPEAEVQDITRQILAGISLMHKAGFAHRDIKPANVLIKKAPPDNWWVKLGDLGLSKRAEAAAGSTTVRATPGFVPPEILGLFAGQDPKRSNPFSADIWCLAETIFHALANRGTFNTYGALMQYVDGRVQFPRDVLVEVEVSDQGIEFMQYLMAPSPPDRLSSEQAIKHPWVWIEDEHQSDDSDIQISGEPHAFPIDASQDEITQPDRSWTTDLDTASVKVLSSIRPGSEEQSSQKISQAVHSSHQKAGTKIVPVMNRLHSVDVDGNPEDNMEDNMEDWEDRVEERPEIGRECGERCASASQFVGFQEEHEGGFYEEQQDGVDEEQQDGFDGAQQGGSEVEHQSAGKDRIETSVYIHERTKRRGHSISAKAVSRRVLSESACRYELSEKDDLITFHKDVSKEEIKDIVALSQARRATSSRSRSRSAK